MVLDTVLREGPISRARIARVTGLSKPTVSAVVETLEDCGLVEEQGRASGAVGRPATLYQANPGAGYVLAVDVGGTKIRVGLTNLNGEIIAEIAEPTDTTDSASLLEQLERLRVEVLRRARVNSDLVRAAGVGVPGVYDPEGDAVSGAPNLPFLENIRLAGEFEERLESPPVIENDVNLAALGERWRGLATGRDNFVAISIGTGIGMGVVIDGEIYRGDRGAAGEIDFLPLGVQEPYDERHREHGPFESAGSGPGIVLRLRRRLEEGAASVLALTDGVQEIFAAAAEADALARDLVEEEARLLALGIAAVVAVLDPELVVLGGGIGSDPVLLEPIRANLARLLPQTPDVQTSALGDRAALYGAIAVGLRSARQALLAEVGGGAADG
jgi:predicted NBD/HSP70 family sugar kinase